MKKYMFAILGLMITSFSPLLFSGNNDDSDGRDLPRHGVAPYSVEQYILNNEFKLHKDQSTLGQRNVISIPEEGDIFEILKLNPGDTRYYEGVELGVWHSTTVDEVEYVARTLQVSEDFPVGDRIFYKGPQIWNKLKNMMAQ